MSEQLSLLDWRPPADILPFPAHRSHGLTVGIARSLAGLETAKRTGKMNSIRAQTRKRLQPLIGPELAEKLADDQIRMIRIQSAYLNPSLPKQCQNQALIFSLTGERIDQVPHGDGAGAASAGGQGTKFLAGLGGAHSLTEFGVAGAREKETA